MRARQKASSIVLRKSSQKTLARIRMGIAGGMVTRFLPNEILEKIISHLDNSDLQDLMQSVSRIKRLHKSHRYRYNYSYRDFHENHDS